jgi:chemotaxis protein methyltransferase CheR
MGHAEPSQEMFQRFRTVNTPGAVLYQRRDGREEGGGTAAAAAPAIRPASMPVAPQIRPMRPPPRGKGSAPKMQMPSAPPAQVQAEAAPAAAVMRIKMLADQGRWDEALAACDSLLAANALDARAHFYRALVLEQLGDMDGCETFLRRAIYLDRHFVLPHYHLGLFQWRREEPAAAGRSFRNVLALLERLPAGDVLADGDDITVGELRDAVAMHLDAIGVA